MTPASMTSPANRPILPKNYFVLRATRRACCVRSSSRLSRTRSRGAVKLAGGRRSVALTESEKYSYPWLQIQLGLGGERLFRSDGRSRHQEKAARTRHGPRTEDAATEPCICAPWDLLAEARFYTGDRPEGWKLVWRVWRATGRGSFLPCEATTCTTWSALMLEADDSPICRWQSGARPRR